MNDIGWLLVLALISMIVIRRTVLRLGRHQVAWFMDPVVLLCGAWLIESVVYSLPIVVNRHPLQAHHVLYISACIASFVMGVMIVPSKSKMPRGPAQSADRGAGVGLLLLFGMAGLGLLGNFAIAYDGLSKSRVSLLERFSGDSLSAIRGETVATATTLQGGPLAMFESFGSASTIFVCMVAAGLLARQTNLARGHKNLVYALAVISVLFVSFNSVIVHGGRIGMVQLLLALVLASMMDSQRWLLGHVNRMLGSAKWPVIMVSLMLSMGGIWYLATDFMKSRTGEAMPLNAMAAYHRTVATPDVEDLVSNNETLQYGLLSLSYLTVPLPTMGYYYDLPDTLFPGPYWGQYNFSGAVTFVMRRMGYLKYQRTISEIREQATASLVRMGYGDNVWSTLLRDIALDVGWSGVPLVMFILGWLSERVMRAARDGDNFIMKILALMTSLLLVFSIAHSLFVIESFQRVYWVCFMILAYQKLLGPQSILSFRFKRPGAVVSSAKQA